MPAIFVNPINEYHLNLLKDLNNQNQDLRVFVSDNQSKEFTELIPGKKAIGDIKDDSHISTACHGAFCAIYFEDDLKELLEYPGPTLIDVAVTEDENCYPMVAPGKSNSQMIGVFKRDMQDAKVLNS